MHKMCVRNSVVFVIILQPLCYDVPKELLCVKKAKIIALAGKGGVGKTSISAAMVQLLMEEKPEARVLAIDADPAVGLSTALGVEVAATLDDIRRDVIASVEGGAPQEALELLGEARFRIFDTLVEKPGFSFLAIGRPESAGCYGQKGRCHGFHHPHRRLCQERRPQGRH